MILWLGEALFGRSSISLQHLQEAPTTCASCCCNICKLSLIDGITKNKLLEFMKQPETPRSSGGQVVLHSQKNTKIWARWRVGAPALPGGRAAGRACACGLPSGRPSRADGLRGGPAGCACRASLPGAPAGCGRAWLAPRELPACPALLRACRARARGRCLPGVRTPVVRCTGAVCGARRRAPEAPGALQLAPAAAEPVRSSSQQPSCSSHAPTGPSLLTAAALPGRHRHANLP